MIAPLRPARGSRLAAALLFCVLAPAWASDPAAAGRTLYREGIGQGGQAVTATVQGDVTVSGATLACVGCHKRSGLGTSEGGARALAVTGPSLFEPEAENRVNRALPRTLYTDETLARAIREGIAADGRVLDPLMPRYRLDDADMGALVAYLHTLGADAAPGVGETEVDIATIVSADAPAPEREAVTAVLRRFAEIKNSGTRQEQRRAAASRRHPYGEKHVRAFRNWNLSVWTLTGPPSGWPAQLDALYAKRPPFVVISGAAGDESAVIQRFCEDRELPCILPVTDLPVETGENHYTVYFSAGVRLDARITASSIAQGYDDQAGRVLLAYVDDARGRAALEAFVAAWPAPRRANLIARPIAPGSTPSYLDWKDLVHRERPDVLVAWLLPSQLQTLTSIASSTDTLPRRIYTAASFTDWRQIQALPVFEQRVLHVYPYSLPGPGLSPFPREDAWLASQGLSQLERIPAAEALFACHVTGEAMADMADNYSREYLIETLEHMLDGTGMTTVFPVTSLGTGQRFLVKGGYVARLAPAGGQARYLQAGWIQP
jgi:hypothetical protein